MRIEMSNRQSRWFSLILISFCFSLLLGCSSTPPKQKEFLEKIAKVSKGLEVAESQMQELCQKNNASACLLVEKDTAKEPSGMYSVVQGGTTEFETQLSVVASKKAKLEFLLKEAGVFRFVKASNYTLSFQKDQDQQVHKVLFSGLELGKSYKLYVMDNGIVADVRNLKAFDPKRNDLKIMIASCMDDSFDSEQKKMWKHFDNVALERGINLVFLIGDNVYADKGINFFKGPAPAPMIWRRYAETRNKLDYYKRKNLLPTYAVWDDHDYGWNNGDKTYAYREEAQEYFRTFWPQDAMKGFLEHGPGISSYIKLSGQKFFFLDDRSFRTPNNQTEGDQSHFGKVQVDWMVGHVKRSRAPIWLISGDQFFGAYHPWESFEGNHPKDFANFKKRLRKLRAPAVFVSGDRHLSEIMQIDKKEMGYKTYELTSSGMHAKVFPGSFKRDPNPRQVKGIDGTYNFMVVEPSLKGRTLSMDVEVFGFKDEKSQSIFKHQLKVRK